MDITVVVSLRKIDSIVVDDINLISEALVEVIEGVGEVIIELEDDEANYEVVSANVTSVEE